jgi:hypothetical protein
MRSRIFPFLLGVAATAVLLGGANAMAATGAPKPLGPPPPKPPQVPKTGIPAIDNFSAKVEGAASKYLAGAAPFFAKANSYLTAIQTNAAARAVPPAMAAPASNFRVPGGQRGAGTTFGG